MVWWGECGVVEWVVRSLDTHVAGVNVFALAPRQLHVIHVARRLHGTCSKEVDVICSGRPRGIAGAIGRDMDESMLDNLVLR
jgi:hypothetical protein